MKRSFFSLLALLLLGGGVVHAQQHAISIAEYDGKSNHQEFLQTPFCDDIYQIMRKQFRKGYRLTATGNQYSPTLQRQCWFFTTAKGTPYKHQQFIVENKGFPAEFIQNGWDEGYAITSFSCNRSLYWVVMSQGSGLSDQSYEFSDEDGIQKIIREKQANGYSVSNLFFDGEKWGAVFSKDPSQAGQRVCFIDENVASEKLKQCINDGLRVQNLTLGGGKYAFTYVDMPKDKAILQNICTEDSDFEGHIADLIKRGYTITSLGCDLDAGGRQPFIRELEENIERQDKEARREERLDKTSKVLEFATVITEGIGDILGILSGDSPSPSSSALDAGSSAASGEPMLNIDEKISQLRSEVAGMQSGSFHGKVPGATRAQEQAATNGTIAEWNKRIAYLQDLKAQGYTEIPVSQWNSYTRGQRDIQRQQHQRDMNRVKDEGERRTGSWRNMSYSGLENTLRDMKNHPDKYLNGWDMSQYRSEVHAIQAKMRQIRADHLQKYGREVFKASELENWNP